MQEVKRPKKPLIYFYVPLSFSHYPEKRNINYSNGIFQA